MTRAKVRPPRAAEWIIKSVAPPDDQPWIVADLADELIERAASQSPAACRRWYWAQTLRSIVPLIWRRLITFTASHRGEHMWNDLAQDLRFAMRLSARTPLTTIVVIATLVLGLGATTSVFSVVDAVLIRPLPFAASSRTVQLFGVLRDGRELDEIAYPDLLDLRAASHTIEALGIGQRAQTTLDHNGEPSRIDAVQVDSGFVHVLDLRAGMGRMFDAESYAVHGPNEVVLSHGFWMREFGGDRSVIGKTITLDGEHSTVIGILEERPFVYPQDSPDVIQPLRLEPGSFFTRRGVMWANALARVRPGVTTDDVGRDVAAVAHRLEVDYAYANKGIGMHVKPLRDAVVGDIGSMLALLTAAVAAVLLIASLNVGNLLLARATARAREFAVRVAIGGSPWRVRRQVLAEAFLLAAVGGVLGLGLAPLITRALLSLYPGDLPRASEIHVGLRALLGALAAILVSSVLASLPAMRQASSSRPGLDLRATGGAGQSSQSRRFGRIVFGAQIAASLTMVFVAGLLVRSLGEMNRIQPGFEATGLLTFIASPSREREPSPAAYYQRLSDALARIPGVTQVSTVFHIPFGGNTHGDVFVREDRGGRGPANTQADANAVAPGFLRTLGGRIIAGRAFTAGDDSAGPPVALINETLARKAFPGEDPIGKQIAFNGAKHRQIVGVIADMKDGSLVEAAPGMLYLPIEQYRQDWARRDRYVLIRTSRDPATLMPEVRLVMHAVDASVPVTDVRTMTDRLATSAAAFRFRALLLGGLSTLAWFLAIVGVYGIVAETVNRQTREIGIRLALGMTSGEVQRTVLLASFRTTLIGVVVGLAMSLAIAPSLRSMLYGVVARDVSLLALATLAVFAAAVAATFMPARRASQVDPIIALRSD
jgi:putative ABC transport system permease protein